MDPICCHYHDLFSSTIFFISHRIKTIENKHLKPSSFLFFTYKYLLKIIYSSMHLKWSVSCSTDWIDFFCLNHKDKKVLHTVQRQKRKKHSALNFSINNNICLVKGDQQKMELVFSESKIMYRCEMDTNSHTSSTAVAAGGASVPSFSQAS